MDRRFGVIKADIEGCDLIAMRGAGRPSQNSSRIFIFEGEEEL